MFYKSMGWRRAAGTHVHTPFFRDQSGSARSRPTETRIVERLRVKWTTRKEWCIEDIGITPSAGAGKKLVTLGERKLGSENPSF